MRIHENQSGTASSIDKLSRSIKHAFTNMKKKITKNIKASVKNHRNPFEFVD